MEPLVFEPYLRPLVWGGRDLGDSLGKKLLPNGTYGESWEISVHRQHVSRVAEGQFRGQPFDDICQQHPKDVFGAKVPSADRFPLLIKLLDCHQKLSVQVHPTDEIAAMLAPGELGKTEAWVILEAGRDAMIYAGLLPGTTRAHLEEQLACGVVDKCLHGFVPKPGDCIFLPAGTVHAVGGGVLMAEVQQSSDATFRLFDWNRLGDDGKPRALHLAESLASIDWEKGPVHPVRPTALETADGNRAENLVRCRYFVLDRYQLQSTMPVPHAGQMSIWMIISGSAELYAEDRSYARHCQRGETVLLPATAPNLRWQPRPNATALCVRLP